MKAIVIDSTGHITHLLGITLNSIECDNILKETKGLGNDNYMAHGRGLLFKYPVSNGYIIVLSDNNNKKKAKHLAVLFAESLKHLISVRNTEQTTYEEIHQTSFHNARNIARSVKGRLDELLDADNSGKIDRGKIAQMITQKQDIMSAEILALHKSLEQMSFEFDISVFLRDDMVFTNADYTYCRLHSLMQMAFYIFDVTLKEKNITYELFPCFDDAYIHFYTMRSAICLLVENCSKYCKPHTKVNTVFEKIGNEYTICINMDSCYRRRSMTEN